MALAHPILTRHAWPEPHYDIRGSRNALPEPVVQLVRRLIAPHPASDSDAMIHGRPHTKAGTVNSPAQMERPVNFQYPPSDLSKPLSDAVFNRVELIKHRTARGTIFSDTQPSFLCSFTQACLLACSREISFRECVDFALPRPLHSPTYIPPRSLADYAQATMMAFSPLHRLGNPATGDDTGYDAETSSINYSNGSTPSSSSASATESGSRRNWSPEPLKMQEWAGGMRGDDQDVVSDYPSSTDSPSDNISINSVYNRNVFREQMNGTEVVCIFVMADHDRIYHAMTSALLSRHCMGILDPIIGLTFAQDAYSLQVVIGWMERSQSDQSLELHVMHANFDANTESTGIFDLCDLPSAQALARFIVSAVGHYEPLNYTSQTLEDCADDQDHEGSCTTSWRADQTMASPDLPSSSQHKSSIEAWLRSVSTVPSKPNLDEETSVGGSHNSTLQLATPDGDVNVEEISMSRFVQLPGARALSGDPATLWLLDRGGRVHSALPPVLQGRSDEVVLHGSLSEGQISGFRRLLPYFKWYNEATRFYWPWGPSTTSLIPPVHDTLSCLRDDLLRAAINEHGVYTEREEFQFEDFLDVMRPVSSDLLGYLLHTVWQSQCAKENNAAHAIPGAQSRSTFDVSYETIFTQENADDKSVINLFNQVLRMPRSTIAKKMRGPPVWIDGTPYLATDVVQKDMKRFIHPHGSILCGNVALLASPDPRIEETPAQAREFSEFNVFYKHTGVWIQCGDQVENRAQEGPATGLCDAISLVEIPSFFPLRLLTQAAAFSLIPFLGSSPSEHKAVAHSLLLPLFVAQYRKDKSADDPNAVKKLRMHMTATVKFLAALGVVRFPVFGVLATGTEAAVVCAWTVDELPPQEHVEPVHILERNGRSYDIATPLGAFNFLTFLGYLRFVHAKELVRRVEAVKEAFLEKLERGDEAVKWTMADQC
ncbi:hypothetical protein BV25DRAFT_1821229 [Artomyces pyxidatus]|uniref:Uncharacterized protein n=1 Tax=Artomyces pyxidatus TaxID=48021 RepID=A0ACB8TCZ5_9AGAM|nr:hypothetical protein BV25DRAFT_1821229 [Artomyces pyxidatus]